MDIDPVPREHVHRVLDGPDAARGGVLSDADVVAHAPAQDPAVVGVVVGAAGRQGAQVKDLDHGAAALDVLGPHIEVGVAAARDDELVGLLLGHEQRAADVVRVVHAADDGSRGPRDRAGARVVCPGEDGLGRGCVQCSAIGVECDAVSQLVLISIAEGMRLWHCWALGACAYISLCGEGRLTGHTDAVAALGERDTGDSRVRLCYKQGAAAVEHKTSCAAHAIRDESSGPALG